MSPPFSVRDADDPGRDLGEWTENGDVRVPGRLTVGGLTTLTSPAEVPSLNVAGDVAVGDDLTVADQLAVTGAAALNGGASVAGGLAVAGGLTVAGGLVVSSGVGSVVRARKTGDTPRSATTTPTDDPHLQVPVVAGAFYEVDGYFIMSSTSETPDIKINANGPDGEHSYVILGLSVTTTSATAGDLTAAAGFITAPLGLDNVDPTGAILMGTFECVASGTYVIQWAQQVSNAAASVLMKNSFIRLTRVA